MKILNAAQMRNIDQRAPYMHDGSMTTLDDVVRHYVDGIEQRPSLDAEVKPLALNDQEVKDLVAFMSSGPVVVASTRGSAGYVLPRTLVSSRIVGTSRPSPR